MWERLLNGYKFPFRVIKCCGIRQRWWLLSNGNILSATELYAFKWLVSCYVNFTPIKKKNRRRGTGPKHPPTHTCTPTCTHTVHKHVHAGVTRVTQGFLSSQNCLARGYCSVTPSAVPEAC